MARKKIIIDTDPGIDDAMAILFALAAPDIHLIGLTTVFGNVPTRIATRNALLLAELAGASIPVSHGAERPLAIPPRPFAAMVHGPDGFGDVPPAEPKGAPTPIAAARHLVEACKADPGAITICAIGPLTNLALALELDPAIAGTAAEIAIMGGSIREGGNVSAFAEANIWHDPHAAEKVFSAGWPVKLTGLDVTHRILCSGRDFEQLGRDAPGPGGFLNEASKFYLRFYAEKAGLDGCHLHDPTTIIAALRPDLFSFETGPVSVALDGERIGETRLADTGGKSITFASGVDASAVKDLFFDTIAGS